MREKLISASKLAELMVGGSFKRFDTDHHIWMAFCGAAANDMFFVDDETDIIYTTSTEGWRFSAYYVSPELMETQWIMPYGETEWNEI